MSVRVSNSSPYPAAEVRRLVRATLRDLDAGWVHVRVHTSRVRDGHTRGEYRSWWYPDRGEDRPVIRVSMPPLGVAPAPYRPYARRQAPPAFDLLDWREYLIAIVAHEGLHHRQTPRNGYRSSRKIRGLRHRYVEHECDWAAYRAVRRWRGELG